jgi:hypothetical protein
MSTILNETNQSAPQPANYEIELPNENPPPYDDVEASYRLFGTIQTVFSAERGEDDDPEETESMRKFLLYCLAVDYRFIGHYELPASEREKYLEMWSLMSRIEKSHDRTHVTEYERCVLAPYFWKYLHQPCARLSIPVEATIRATKRFFKYSSNSNVYKGCVYGLLHVAGPEIVAEKLWLDRNILIPQIVETELERQGLTACLTDVARQYFVTIDGLDNNVYPDRLGEWAQHSRISYKLTARGASYDLSRSGAMIAAACDYARTSWKFVQSCVTDMSARQTIFPEGRLYSDRRATWNGPEEHETWRHAVSEGQRSTLKRWPWHGESHLPDFFEHRPGDHRCDT